MRPPVAAAASFVETKKIPPDGIETKLLSIRFKYCVLKVVCRNEKIPPDGIETRMPSLPVMIPHILIPPVETEKSRLTGLGSGFVIGDALPGLALVWPRGGWWRIGAF